ncbi:MFS transporter [Micromonospora sp. WMMD987]|uniref:MFS transporter n=1 Tax=Micromonospora sp. WMMD987 TaxID=3016089 RepID=UPI00249A855B|nr:MFS transporter [Micromonospora sp. WMMD987]WFE95315.1 MFS transporter [Micromonospora sp. WMMD987]
MSRPVRNHGVLATAALFGLNGLLMGSFATRIPDLKHGLHATDGAFGLALIGATVGAVGLAGPAGAAVARYGAGRVARLSVVGTPVAMLLLPIAGTLTAFGGLLVLFGAAAVTLNTAANSMAADVERLLDRSVMSRMHALYSSGGLVGAVTGGLAATTGRTATTQFAALTVLCLAVSISVRDSRIPVPRRAPEPAVGAIRPVRSRPAMLLAAMAFCFYVAEAAIDDWSAIYLHDALAAPAALVGAGYGAFSVTMAIGRLFGDRVIDAIGAVRAVRIGSLLAGAALALGVSMRTLPAAIAGFALFGLGMCIVAPACYGAAGRHGNHMIARVTATGHIGLLIGPAAIGGLSHLSGLRTAMLVPGALALLIAASATAVSPVGHAKVRELL